MRRRNRTGKQGGQKHNDNTVKTGATRSDRALLHDKEREKQKQSSTSDRY